MAKKKESIVETDATKVGIVNSITGKLLLLLLPMTSIAIIFMIVFLSMQASGIIVDLAGNSLKQETIANANSYSGRIATFIGRLDTMAITLEQFKIESNEDILDFLTRESTKFSKDAPNGIYLALDDGSWIDPSGWMPDEDYVAADRPWYQDGIKNDTFKLGRPYFDAVTESMVVPVARKITLADGRSGVAATDMSLSSITKTVSELNPMGRGKTMLFDGDAIISYFDESYNGSLISEHTDDEFLNVIGSEGDGNNDILEIKANGTTYYVYKSSVEGTSWMLVSSVEKSDVFADLNRFQLICWILAIVIIILIAVIMFRFISRIITKPVKVLTNNIVRITNSDFTVDIKEKGKDEISVMNSNMKKFIAHMRSSLEEMRAETIQLSDEANQSRNSSDSMSVQARKQSDSMDQIRGAMDGMSSAVTELAENATELAGMVNDLTSTGNETDGIMKLLIEKAGEGQRDMQVVTSSMETISVAMREMNEVVETVEESASQITGIVEMINQIAAQTNLLSLNASIEAARAGEAGKGFAVVATEIGSLANDSANASQEIGTIINKIMGQIENLTQKSAANMDEIDRSTESVSVAESTFKEIFHNLDLTDEAMKKMIKMMGDIDGIAMNVAAISEEQSASSVEVSETVDSLAISAGQVAEESQSVTDSANTVSESAETINNFVATFKLD